MHFPENPRNFSLHHQKQRCFSENVLFFFHFFRKNIDFRVSTSRKRITFAPEEQNTLCRGSKSESLRCCFLGFRCCFELTAERRFFELVPSLSGHSAEDGAPANVFLAISAQILHLISNSYGIVEIQDGRRGAQPRSGSRTGSRRTFDRLFPGSWSSGATSCGGISTARPTKR